MVFCNALANSDFSEFKGRHNPYFNRWFSAMQIMHLVQKCLLMSHNPYFNRWFSAIIITILSLLHTVESHNPYFNRWFSAIIPTKKAYYR